MGYRAHQVIRIYPTDKTKEGRIIKKMRDGDECVVFLQKDYYICSAYDPDEINGPEDVLQKFFSCRSSDEGDSFEIDDSDLKDLETRIKDQFPKHPDSKKFLKILKDIRNRYKNMGFYQIECY